jgi:hypothetical protein
MGGALQTLPSSSFAAAALRSRATPQMPESVRLGGARMPKTPMITNHGVPLWNFSALGAFDRDASLTVADFMPKTRKTAQELADMITTQLGVCELAIGVRKDHAYGWQPMIEYAPGNHLGFQRRADEIADKLRQDYDLKE